MGHQRVLQAALILFVVATGLGADETERRRIDSSTFLRGMTVSCPRAGQIWGSDDMRETLDAMPPLGVEWVALHPYAWIGRDGEIRFRPAAETGYLDRAVAMTRAKGIELFWKPHLGYWGSFEWRGAIEFGDDEAAWQRFFSGYRAFILDQAAFAEANEIPLFAVGVELEATTHREREWRALIAEIRSVYHGEITYAANWDRLDRVPFWDAVDLIGAQAYFPLDAGSADPPSVDQLVTAWQPHLDALANRSKAQGGKRVLFTEAGFNRSSKAAREPWDYQVEDSPANRELRRRLIEATAIAAAGEPIVAGIFWWKWMPGAYARRTNFSMRDDEAVEALRRQWRSDAK